MSVQKKVSNLSASLPILDIDINSAQLRKNWYFWIYKRFNKIDVIKILYSLFQVSYLIVKGKERNWGINGFS